MCRTSPAGWKRVTGSGESECPTRRRFNRLINGRREPSINSLIQDVRYGLRSLVNAPGFSAVAVFTLALGVGAKTTIFTVLRAVVLRDLPYRDADRIAVMWTRRFAARNEEVTLRL